MSLINDALKRANETRPQSAPTADGPALRPHLAPRRSSAGNGWLLPVLIALIFALAALLLWQWFHGGSSIPVRARTSAENIQPAQKAEPVASAAPQTSVASPSVVEKVAETNLASSATATPSATKSQTTNAATTTNLATTPPPPAPPTYKLQSLFYRAKNPSAVINGKTVFIGDHVSGARVIAIDKDSATIRTPKGETKELDLP